MVFINKAHSAPIYISTGEPAGIGPDICLLLADFLSRENVVLLGDLAMLKARAKQLNLDVNLAKEDDNIATQATTLRVLDIPCQSPVIAGQLKVDNAAYVLRLLEIAADSVLAGTAAAIVTAPLQKSIICDSGISFSGHTEFFADRCQTKLPVMMLATETLRVALLTTHLPLQAVSAAISIDSIVEICRIIDHDLRYYFGKTTPKIALCGINPHAGENGYLGHEEIDVMQPALLQLQSEGIHVDGPFPADTIFVPKHANHYDVIVAAYHDQGLPVIKAQGFGHCANITLGLPIIRTSVDHGTALDLAGTGKANPSSLRFAIDTAKAMVAHRAETAKKST